MKRTYASINEKIQSGQVVVMTAEDVVDLVKAVGIKEATAQVDVVTTATFGPMCSSGAFLNFGHTSPAIRMESIRLNDVPASGGLAAVDTYIGATEESLSLGYEYGGAHVICDLIEGKSVHLEATGKGTDCYPKKNLSRQICLEDLNEAYLYNPRNCYQNYAAACNTSSRTLHTYMGTLQGHLNGITYSTSGTLSPLLNDPYYRTIGIGTRIFLAGATGYVAFRGTQFNSGCQRDENGIPLGTGATLALIGDMKKMDRRYIAPGVYQGYGTSMFVGVGIPIPILDEAMMAQVAIGNDQLFTNILDYSVPSNRPTIKRVSYEALQSGSVDIDGKCVKTAPLSSIKKAREIADLLKASIESGDFLLTQPLETFDSVSITRPMKKGGGPMRTKMIMKFDKDLTNQPVTYELVKKYDLRVNILKADINDKLQGYVVVDIDGDSKNLAQALKYLEGLGVDADLITNTIAIDRNLCVSCGLCTGACGVRALTLSRDTWSLVYVENRCVGCNRCVGACPTRAIKNLVW